MTIEDIRALHVELRKHSVPPFMIEGEPYILLDAETGKILNPDEWRIAEDPV